jgi:adenylate kinase family enzyme
VKRVAVVGSGGAGKSRLAIAIGERTGLPVVHLDPLFWRAGWTAAPEEESRRALQEVIAADRWVLDGNFLTDPPAVDPRFDRADTLIWLDPPRWKCMWRVLSRLVRDRGRVRPDLPLDCFEGFDLPFLKEVWSYPRDTRPDMVELMGTLGRRLETHRLRTDADVRRFLGTL